MADAVAEPRPARRRTVRRGLWVHGGHRGLNPGWRLPGTCLVLDYDPITSGCALPGAWILFRDGQYTEVIDHYLDSAMRWIENLPAAELTRTSASGPDADLVQQTRQLAVVFDGTVGDLVAAVRMMPVAYRDVYVQLRVDGVGHDDAAVIAARI